LIIELHEFIDPDVAAKVTASLRPTHETHIYDESVAPLRWLDTLYSIPASAVPSFVNETGCSQRRLQVYAVKAL